MKPGRTIAIALFLAAVALPAIVACVGDEPATDAVDDAGAEGGGADSGGPDVTGVDAACTPNVKRCDGQVLWQCNASGKGEFQVAVCGSSRLCDPGKDACLPPSCAATDSRCVDGGYETCNADLTGYQLSATCATRALCVPDAGCKPPACPAPSFGRCISAATCKTEYDGGGVKVCAEICKTDLTGWKLFSECKLCDFDDAGNGSCSNL